MKCDLGKVFLFNLQWFLGRIPQPEINKSETILSRNLINESKSSNFNYIQNSGKEPQAATFALQWTGTDADAAAFPANKISVLRYRVINKN